MAKSLAVLTSGGDAPGMNAAVRAVVRAGIYNGFKVYGVYKGYNGLLNGDVKEMDLRSVSDILSRGGTILYTARSKKFMQEEYQLKAAEYCRSLDIEGLVVIGGDGSFRGARALSNAGIPTVALPGTIDNDIACSDYTIGFDTAMNTAVEMIDKIRDTAQSHDRCSVVEVMGRHCGDIALHTGIAVGATAIIVPEIERRNRSYLRAEGHRQKAFYYYCGRGRRRRSGYLSLYPAPYRYRDPRDHPRSCTARRFAILARQTDGDRYGRCGGSFARKRYRQPRHRFPERQDCRLRYYRSA